MGGNQGIEGGDQGVEGADRCALALQISPQIAIGPEGRFIKRQDRQRCQKQIPISPMR